MTLPNGTEDTTSQNNEQEVEISEDELALLDDDTTKKVQTLSAQKAHFREKAKKLEEELKGLREKVKSSEQPPSPAPASSQTPSAEEAAKRAILALRVEEDLSQVPDDKKATVKEFYSSLTSGKNLDIASHNTYLEAAKRAAGIVVTQGRSHHIYSSAASGSVPPVAPPGPTPEQIRLARLAGNDPNKVYGKEANYSDLHNAERFLKPSEDIN